MYIYVHIGTLECTTSPVIIRRKLKQCDQILINQVEKDNCKVCKNSVFKDIPYKSSMSSFYADFYIIMWHSVLLG